jgi:hypothetical protein
MLGIKRKKRKEKARLDGRAGQDTRARFFVCYDVSITTYFSKVKAPEVRPNGRCLWAH